MKNRTLAFFISLMLIITFAPKASADTAPYFLWPTSGKSIYVLDNYVTASYGTHNGIDISVTKQPVYAVSNGTVVYVVNDCSHYWTTAEGKGHCCGESTYGNYIKIQYEIGGKTYTSIYAHLLKDSMTVKVGDTVSAGQQIATSGSSGSSTGPHLHFALFEGSNTDDKRRRSFQYFLNEPGVLNGMSFRGTAVEASDYFKDWIKENCTLSSDGYYYYDSSNTQVFEYLDQCTSSACNVELTVTTAGNMKNMPCSVSTNSQSQTVEALTLNSKYNSTTRWNNTEGNIWYEVTSKTGQRGFIYSGDVNVKNATSTLKVTGNEVSSTEGTPSGTLTKGNNFGLRGVISSNYTIKNVIAHIYNDSTGSDAVYPFYNVTWDKTSYDIKTDGINDFFSFRSLPEGSYRYMVFARDSSMNDVIPLIDSRFTVGTVTYTISYNANSGTGAPANQTKTYGTNLTLSSTKPTRANSNPGSYVVTLNANGGSVSSTSLSAARSTSYTFKNWNTAANGSGTNYNAGASYTANAAATLYAQWNSSTSTAAVTLPTPTRTGYTFKGWGTSSTATSGVTGSYTPTGNVTLYAVWESNALTMQYNANGGTVGINDKNFTRDNDGFILRSGNRTVSTWRYGSYYEDGLINDTSFVLSRPGYSFQGWRVGAYDNAAVIDQNIPLTPETICPELKNGNQTITLYAVWETNGIAVSASNFPDSAFRAYVSENCDTDKDGYLDEKEIATVKKIDVSGEYQEPGAITSLKGIEYFSKLQYLSCSSNQLTELDVSSNTAMRGLNCYNNKLTQLKVNNNASLESLHCQMNKLRYLDVHGCTALQYLACNDNYLSSVDVSNNVVLTDLSCHNNLLSSLDVSNNSTLEVLTCWNNQINSLNVSNNDELRDLECGSNHLTSLNVSSNKALEILDCQDNQLTDLNVSDITTLHTLLCNINRLETLNLGGNTGLIFLCCHSNRLTNLNLSKNTILEHLDCGSNLLKNLNLNNTEALVWLDCLDNKLTELDISQSPMLVTLVRNTSPELYNIVSYGPDEDNRFLRYDGGVMLYADPMSNSDVELNESNFPDSSFRSYVAKNCDKDKDGYLSAEEFAAVKEINVYDKQISSLDGIEYFTALEKLDCSFNQLSILDVSKNTALIELNCGSNLLTSLDVSNNNALQILWCSNNQLKELNVSANTELRDLSCNGNKLAELNVRNNVLLESLMCGHPFSNVNQGNLLTSLDVSNNPKLTALFCDSNQLSSLSISNNRELLSLTCSRNKLTKLDVTNNTKLSWLSCWNNQLVELDVSSCPELHELSASNNQLTKLNITGCTELHKLYCSWNQLQAVDVSGCLELQSFECGANPIGNLDISNNPAMWHLGCFENQLTELDLSNNAALQEVWCYSNQLENLDLSKCKNLVFLSCWDNRLPILNVRNNSALQRLFCYQNRLSSLDISACPNLAQLTTNVLPTEENNVVRYVDQENSYALWVDEGLFLISSLDSITPDLTLPAALTTIESEAFAGGGFSSVLIPPTVNEIAPDAFGDRTDLIILGTSGSYAETFAGEKHFTFVPAA